MAAFTHINLRADVDDQAPAAGMEGIEARFATGKLEAEESGLSIQRLDPGVRQPFGHRHTSQEEVYVVVEGGGLVLGASAPVILTSRADDERVRLGSCAVAALYWHWQNAGVPVAMAAE